MNGGSTVKAYAILDGGGVKGAALAGCLQAAEDLHIQFEGYAGTSAGSIVALLASVGYTADEMRRIMTREVNFTDFLDDSGAMLEKLKEVPQDLPTAARRPWRLYRYVQLMSHLAKHLGLYQAHKLQRFLIEKITDKLPALRGQSDITFDDLEAQGCRPLKIIAADIGLHTSVVYGASSAGGLTGSVIDAVRASMSYPFVFRPVPVNDRFLVDGGLSSNLPVFAFEKERRANRLPVVAFDLVASSHRFENSAYGLRQFCGDMLSTALESSDHLLREIVQGLYHVPIEVPAGIGTLDFSLSEDKRVQLFEKGVSATHSFFSKVVPHWSQATSAIEHLQALHAPPSLVAPVLQAIAAEIEARTPARNIRCSIMLPTLAHTRIVVYHYGMDHDPDVDLELSMDGGCSGQAWSLRRPVFANLLDVQAHLGDWNMTREQQNRVERSRKAMFSVPIFERSPINAQRRGDLDLLGILSIDTDTPIDATLWLKDHNTYVVQRTKQWADVLAKVLS